jgi:Domain of Unknown Function (DUF349)
MSASSSSSRYSGFFGGFVAFKALIDRLRTKPEWQHPDAAVRAEAVLRIPASEADLLRSIAREDPEPRVRRAAVKKVADAGLLAEVAREDQDSGIREEATARLVGLAVHAPDDSSAEAVLALLADQRSLAEIAKSASRETTRRTAVGRLHDAKALATVVRECGDPGTKLAALGKIEDQVLLAGFAQKSDVKAVALAAVERVEDKAALEVIASRARVPAAAKRARTLLARAETTLPPTVVAAVLPVLHPDADEHEREAYERERTRLESEARAHEDAVRIRVQICDALDGASGSEALHALETARAEWAALPAWTGPESVGLASRFEEAALAGASRHEVFVAAEARRGELDTLCTRAEGVAELADLSSAQASFEPLLAEWQKRATERTTPEDLRTRFETVEARLEARRLEARGAEEQRAKENRARLAELAQRLESLAKADTLTLRDADRAVRDARTALEDRGPLPSKHDKEAVRGRIEAARKALFPRLKELREEAEWKHFANVDVQEDLCKKAEALKEAEDLEKAAEQLRDLDARWKQAREAPKDQAEALWTRFKAARDTVRARCDAYFAKKAEELAHNLGKKEALCVQAEALADSGDWLKTTEALKKLQAEWKEIGPVAHNKSKPVWDRFRKACDRFFSRRDEDRGRRREEGAQNLDKKRELCARAEALAESNDWDTALAQIKALQGEWKQVGPVRASQSDAVWKRFRSACDLFFDRFKRRDELADDAAVAAREALCTEVEGLGAEPVESLAAKVLAAQASWRQAKAVSREKAEALGARFAAAVAGLIEGQPAAFAGTELDPEVTLKKMEKLCAKVEAAHAAAAPEGNQPAVADLAKRLRDALASNTIGGREAVEAKWREATVEVEAAESAWHRLGPAPGGQDLRARFDRVKAAFFAARPVLSEPKAPERRDRDPRPERRPRSPRNRDAQPRR